MKRWIRLLGALTLAACQRTSERLWSGCVEGEYVYVASPFGGALTTLAVKRGDNAAIAPWRNAVGLTWTHTEANLEDVFISLLADAPDNFKKAA
jgi:hypothetical protein